MYSIDKATMDHFQSVKELNSLLDIVDVEDFYWNSDAYIRNAIIEERCCVVMNNPGIKGAMILEDRAPDSRHDRKSLAVGTLAVLPEFRKEGFGVQLVELAKDIASKENKRLYVESFVKFNMRDFYIDLGFQEEPLKIYQGEPYHVFFIDL